MKGFWKQSFTTVSAVGVILLIAASRGAELHFITEQPLVISPWEQISVVIFRALWFPLAAPLYGIAVASGRLGLHVVGGLMELLSFIGLVVDAWLYGYLAALGISAVRARFRHRAV